MPALALCAVLAALFDAPAPQPSCVRAGRSAELLSAQTPGAGVSSVAEVVSLPSFRAVPRDEAPRFSGASGPQRRWSDGAARLDAQVMLVARRFGFYALLLADGRTADRPLVLTCPAQGPPSGA
ncbi:MAG: hypothetical protein Q8L48_20765 [Archangium sp.]|nr:hypothetical protein [Archangium sp.]